MKTLKDKLQEKVKINPQNREWRFIQERINFVKKTLFSKEFLSEFENGSEVDFLVFNFLHYGHIEDYEPLKNSYRLREVTYLKPAQGKINNYKLLSPVKELFKELKKEGLNPYIYRVESPSIFQMDLSYSLRVNPKLELF